MEWLSENALGLAGLGGLATVITAVIAVATLMRAGLDSASRTRPYVVVEFRVPDFAFKKLTLVVRNAGPSAARNLTVRFDPPFVDSGDPGRLSRYVARRYAQSISVLGPGQELTSLVKADPDNEEESDVPDSLIATVSYKSPWWRLRNYRDTFALQRVVYTQQVFSSSSDSVRGRLKTITEVLKKMESHQQTWGWTLTTITSAISDASKVLAPPHPGVLLRVRHVSEDTYALDNLGGETAFQVELTAAKENMRGPDLRGDQQDLGTKESLEFTALGTLASGAPAVLVEWSELPDKDHRISATYLLPTS